jgi:branched-subunit amino acid ABC-type transport system permease component
MDFASILIQTLNSLQYGLLLFLVASGLTLVFGIMGIINLAHGSFYMIGAYLAFVLTASPAACSPPSCSAFRSPSRSARCSNGRSSPTSTSATTWSRCC